MTLCLRCTGRVARAPIHHKQWRQISQRKYSSGGDGSAPRLTTARDEERNENWFEELRKQMLERKLPQRHDYIDGLQEQQLYATLHDIFLTKKRSSLTSDPPRDGSLKWAHPLPKHPSSVGDHLVYFNPRPPIETLFPDGTDNLHSPGGPFVRRMWAGGSLRVNKALYFDADGGWHQGKKCICAERIKDVRQHGQGDTAKIFVTIERRFAREDQFMKSVSRTSRLDETENSKTMEQLQSGLGLDGWRDAFLVEERNLVFMQERSTVELENFKAGKTMPTRYINPPGTWDFSHVLTPTSAMLFRFSALTFNAHAIHLDRDYARSVEGHRNLLVHGPLTLMLMLKLVSGHLHAHPGALQTIESIDYRNIAPLYCDEELRICAREKTALRTADGNTYDVWIEGPTGGMAVKATVRTGPVPK